MTTAPAVADDFTDQDAGRLIDCERIIERGLKTFVEVGQALAEIRDGRLYRTEYTTFEQYCALRWSLSRPRAYQLIEAASVVSTTVDSGLPAPANERQARELARVPEEQRAEVWTEARERSNGRPTAATIREVVDERQPKPAPDPWHCQDCGHHWPVESGQSNDCPQCGGRGDFYPAATRPRETPERAGKGAPSGALAPGQTGGDTAPPPAAADPVLVLRHTTQAGWIIGPLGALPYATAGPDIAELDVAAAQAWAAEETLTVERREVIRWRESPDQAGAWIAVLTEEHPAGRDRPLSAVNPGGRPGPADEAVITEPPKDPAERIAAVAAVAPEYVKPVLPAEPPAPADVHQWWLWWAEDAGQQLADIDPAVLADTLGDLDWQHATHLRDRIVAWFDRLFAQRSPA